MKDEQCFIRRLIKIIFETMDQLIEKQQLLANHQSFTSNIKHKSKPEDETDFYKQSHAYVFRLSRQDSFLMMLI